MFHRIKHYFAERRGIQEMIADTSTAGRTLAEARTKADRDRVRKRCDEMRADLGLPQVIWPR